MLDWFENLPPDRKIWYVFIGGATLIALLMYCLGSVSLLFRSSLGGLAPPQFTILPTLTPLSQPPALTAESTAIQAPTASAEVYLEDITEIPEVTVSPLPSASPSPSPLPVFIASPTTVSVNTPTTSPTAIMVIGTPTGVAYTAPVLLNPELGDVYSSGDTIVLQWKWRGTLTENEWFDIQMWHEGEEPRGIAWSKETSFELAPNQTQAGEYRWRVVVLEHIETTENGTKIWEPLSEPSKIGHFAIE